MGWRFLFQIKYFNCEFLHKVFSKLNTRILNILWRKFSQTMAKNNFKATHKLFYPIELDCFYILKSFNAWNNFYREIFLVVKLFLVDIKTGGDGSAKRDKACNTNKLIIAPFSRTEYRVIERLCPKKDYTVLWRFSPKK